MALTFLEKTREKVTLEVTPGVFCLRAEQESLACVTPVLESSRGLDAGIWSQVTFIQPLEHTWLQVTRSLCPCR